MSPAEVAALRKWAESERRGDVLRALDLLAKQSELIAALVRRLEEQGKGAER